MRRLMPTAKTTVLPANDSPTTKNDLLYAKRLDDSLGGEQSLANRISSEP